MASLKEDLEWSVIKLCMVDPEAFRQAKMYWIIWRTILAAIACPFSLMTHSTLFLCVNEVRKVMLAKSASYRWI